MEIYKILEWLENDTDTLEKWSTELDNDSMQVLDNNPDRIEIFTHIHC